MIALLTPLNMTSFLIHSDHSSSKPTSGVPPVPSIPTELLSKPVVSTMETVALEPSIHVQIVIGKNSTPASQPEDGKCMFRLTVSFKRITSHLNYFDLDRKTFLSIFFFLVQFSLTNFYLYFLFLKELRVTLV